MTRTIKIAFFVLLLRVFFGTAMQAQTINAASCNASDVQTAFNSVTAATTIVSIPAGTCNWPSHVYLNVPSGSTTLSIIGAGNLTTTGGGDVTVITDNDTTDSNYLIQLNTGVAASHFRFAGITMNIGSGAIKDNGMLAVNGFSQNTRLDHLHLNAGPYAPIRIGAGGWIYGVIDHCIIENSGAIEVWSDDWGNPGGSTNQQFFGDGSWAAATSFGSASAIFIEDNIFNSGSISGQSSSYMSDCYSGGRVVYRHNTMNNVGVDTHPTGGAGADIRGCRSTEIYHNAFNGAIGSTSMTYDTFYMQSGTALVWGNTAKSYEHFIDLHTTRVSNVTYGQSPTPGGWGYCGVSSGLSGDKSAWDQAPSSPYGYKCLDEPGTGKSDLLTGTAPGKVDSTTGTLTWPNQALEPVYEWLNTFTPTSGYSNATYVNGYAPGLTANIDYYAYTPSFTGATGTGSGLLSARPSTCKPSVAYWATDTNTLYQCSATNTWTTYYTPYTYPHPLTTGTSDTQPPTVPQTLTASAVSSSAINLSWTASTDNVGVTGYTIYRGGVQVGTSATNSYSDTGLTASTQYTYTVSAFDAAGNQSAQSVSASAITAALTIDPPTVPQSLTASAVSSSVISLSWAASTEPGGVVAGYTIYRGGVQVGTSASNSYSDSGLTASTQYSYAVDAYDTVGNHSAQSASASATTAAQTAQTGGTPTLVQHVATGMDRYPVTNMKIPLPNPVGAGNALILGVQFHSSGSISSVADDKGNTWVAGPTATNSSASQRMSLYYALNVTGGTQAITITFSGLGSTNAYPQAVVSEFYNIAQVSAADGSSGNATSRAAGAITTTTAGALIYHWGVDFSDTNVNGGAYNGSSITAGAGFTLLSADLQVGSADQYQVQSSAGGINPTFTASGSATWGSLALALKSASAGTPPPPGIRIVHIQHTLLNSVRAQNRPNPIVMQFPSSGNLVVGLYNSADTLISGVSDSAQNTWASAGSTIGDGGNTQAQIMYAANATTGPAVSGITVALNGTTQGDNQFNLYDIAGAATSPFDKSSTALGNQTSAGNLTTTTLTPSTANGLVLNQVAIDFHTINGVVGANYILDSDVNAFDNDDPPNGGTDVSTLDMDNGYAHIYNTTTGAVTFVYTYTQTTSGGVQTWGAVAAAFKAAIGGGVPAPPTGLQATAH